MKNRPEKICHMAQKDSKEGYGMFKEGQFNADFEFQVEERG